MSTTIETLYQTFINYWGKHIEPYKDKTPNRLYSPIHYVAEGGGKRMRPVFALMAAELFSSDLDKALPAGFCVELFHNFTLLHDDIMDEAPLRRGRQTVHEKWDTNTAILSGDLMMIESLRHLSVIDDVVLRARISEYFLAGAVAVCEGQQLDMDFETRDDVLLPEYIKMIQLKTAALLAEGMAMGAACGGATPEQDEEIRKFGYLIGTAFQIQDDILDTYGDPSKFGKKVGGDIAQNKKTYLYLRALEIADEENKKLILHHYSEKSELSEKDKIQKVTQIFDELGIRDEAEKEKERCKQEAFQCLDALGFTREKTEKLKFFAQKLAERES